MTKKAKKQFDKLIDDALMLINIPAAKDDNEKLSAKERRAQARTRLETIMEKNVCNLFCLMVMIIMMMTGKPYYALHSMASFASLLKSIMTGYVTPQC